MSVRRPGLNSRRTRVRLAQATSTGADHSRNAATKSACIRVAGHCSCATVSRPLTTKTAPSSADYERILIEKGEKSTFQKTKVAAKATADDFAKSFR